MKQTPIAQAAHALFSASGAEGWLSCAPKLAVEQGQPDSTSKYAAEGTAAHELASWCLDAVVKIGGHLNEAGSWAVDGARAEHYLGNGIEADGFHFEIDDDMAGHVQKYVDSICHRIGEFYLRGAVTVKLLVEVRVDYSRYIGQPDSFGTSDVVLLVEWPDDVWQIDVGDLKYGMGVQVFASEFSHNIKSQAGNWDVPISKGNKQMMLYALGAMDRFSMVCEPTLFSMSIYQPRIFHTDSWECDLATLMEYADEVKAGAAKAVFWLNSPTPPETSDFTPGEKQCRWCRVGGTCKARIEKNLATLAGDFVDLDDITGTELVSLSKGAALAAKETTEQHLDTLFPALDEFENWIKAVRGEIEKRALAGAQFSSCKLVQGKRGARAWSDPVEAEKLMKGMRLKVDQMYDFKLISPTTADKLLSDQPKRWNKLDRKSVV